MTSSEHICKLCRSKNNLIKCINIYRSHKPSIFINKEFYNFILDFGKKLFSGSPSDAAKDQSVIEAYLGVSD